MRQDFFLAVIISVIGSLILISTEQTGFLKKGCKYAEKHIF